MTGFLLVGAAAAAPQVATIATSREQAFAGGFAFPVMGGTRTLFAGTASSGNSMELVSSEGGTLTTIASTGKRGFVDLADATAVASATTFVGSTKSEVGVYVALQGSKAAGSPTLIAGSGAASGFGSVSNPALDVLGQRVAFQGVRNGVAGIFGAPANGKGTVATLVDASQPIPGGGGAVMKCAENPSVGLDGTVAFFGSSCDGVSRPMLGGARMRRSVRASDHAIKDPAVNLQAGIFLAAMQGAPPPALRVAADFHSSVPGGGEGERFVAFSNPVAGDASVAFVAQTSAGSMGVYVFDLASSTLHLVANTATPVPGGVGDGAFGDFPYPPAVQGNTTVFYAAAGGDQSGIYAHRRSARGEELAAVITQADSLNGGEPISFLGCGAGATDGKTVSFYGVTSSADGVYSVALPGSIRSVVEA